LIIKTALLKWVELIGELTHPGFASLAIPLFAFGGKREFEKIVILTLILRNEGSI
jgi:hypothetical protein